ncbi:MAG: hypothetical protein JXR70_14700 [Spirochaetales bacterium]|nr:hypothetical protein [Spirochaetales bacterium]
MIDALYYLFLTFLYVLLLFKIDILNLHGDFIYIFFSELAVNMAVYSNVFELKFRKLKFLRNDKKLLLEIAFIYLFFLLFAGGFYYKKSLYVPLALFAISLLAKFLRLNLQKDWSYIEENFRIAAFQLAFFVVAMIVAVVFNSLGYKEKSEIIWGIVYSALTFLSLLLPMIKKRLTKTV